ncbi:MAG: YDG domain-containing protein, partial [Verrucomicrobiaceae bacterium]
MKTNLQNLLLKNVRCIVLLTALMLAIYAGTAFAGTFTAGNLAIIQADSSSANNTTCTVIELSPSVSGQTPSNSIAIDGTTTPNELRFSGSASSTCYLSHTNDGTLLVFTGHNSTSTGVNANTLTAHGVGTFNSAGSFALPTTYTGVNGQQTRSATSVNNTTWFIADQNGLYTNGASSASPAGNFRGAKSFGGTVYVCTASASIPPVGTIAAATGSTFTALPGLANGATTRQDFYLISSGSNGSTYDVLYVLDDTTGTAVGTIFKYSLVSGSWTANGSYTTNFDGFGLAAAKSGSGAALYATTGSGATAANSVVKVTDTAGYNSTIAVTTANNVTLYTAPAGTTVKGIDFAPTNIVPSGTLTALSTTYGTASSTTSFSVSAVGLAANLVVTAPSGFEVSTTAGSGYGSSVSLTPSSGSVSSTTIYVRLAASTAAGSYSGNITCASSGVGTQNVAIPSSTVSAKGLTITGVSGVSKTYDATTAATLSGTPAYVGLENGESFAVTGTAAALFNTAAAGTGKAITITGYTAPSTNYTVSQPAGVTADINQKTLTITANDLTKSFGTTITGGAGSTAFTSIGLVNSESIGSVTIAYGSGASAGDAPGIYLGSV